MHLPVRPMQLLGPGLAGSLLLACSDRPVDPPAFSLLDQNPASERFGEAVSPDDYLGTRSAWYFGHAS